MGNDSLVRDPVPARHITVQLGGTAMEGVGERVGQMMENEADREPEEEKSRRKALSMEDLRRKYSWWPNGSSKEPIPLIDMEAMDGEGAVPRGVKSTKL